MDNVILFFIDGIEFHTDKPTLSVAEILNRVNKPVSGFYLHSKTTNTDYRDPNAAVELQKGEEFISAKKDDTDTKPVEMMINYEVNGEHQTTSDHTLSLETILANAGIEAGIDTSKLSNYYLEDINSAEKYDDLNDLVGIKNGDKFLAVFKGSTPVA